jgi:tetratricopeptide (TPR) repeat protein
MTGGDDDIAASLPRPPLPSPARRRSAIDSALRRFDGAEDPAAAAEERRPARPSSWLRPGRPYAGALAGAFLVAVIGLPFAWTSFDRYSAGERAEVRAGGEAPPSPPAMDDAALPAADVALPGPEAIPPPPAPAGEDRADAARPPAGLTAPPPAAAAAGGEARARAAYEPSADAAAPESELVVTGSRIRRPNLESSAPMASVGDEPIAVTGARIRRGDWNACTIDDPKRDLRACGREAAARAGSGKAAAPLAEGLSRAWRGDLEAAVESFDRAAEAAPRSAAAYLNRGLARRRLGDSSRALADLDRAVALAPRSARAHYHRSLLLRERGETRRARADEERAVELDPDYAELVRAQRRRAR